MSMRPQNNKKDSKKEPKAAGTQPPDIKVFKQ